MKHQTYTCIAFALVVLTMSCGPENGEGNNSNPGPVCESVPQPSEMQNCVADDLPNIFFTRDALEKLCGNRCSTLRGFRLTSSTPLTDSLGFLNGVSMIETGMTVKNTVGLTSLEGVGNIEIIGTPESADELALRISENRDLMNTDGFSSLKRVGGNLRLSLNENLTDVSGFPELEEIQGALIIELHAELTDISGFPKLHTVTDGIVIDGNGKLSRCKVQEFVDGIENVGGEVVIRANGPCEEQ